MNYFTSFTPSQYSHFKSKEKWLFQQFCKTITRDYSMRLRHVTTKACIYLTWWNAYFVDFCLLVPLHSIFCLDNNNLGIEELHIKKKKFHSEIQTKHSWSTLFQKYENMYIHMTFTERLCAPFCSDVQIAINWKCNRQGSFIMACVFTLQKIELLLISRAIEKSWHYMHYEIQHFF